MVNIVKLVHISDADIATLLMYLSDFSSDFGWFFGLLEA